MDKAKEGRFKGQRQGCHGEMKMVTTVLEQVLKNVKKKKYKKKVIRPVGAKSQKKQSQ